MVCKKTRHNYVDITFFARESRRTVKKAIIKFYFQHFNRNVSEVRRRHHLRFSDLAYFSFRWEVGKISNQLLRIPALSQLRVLHYRHSTILRNAHLSEFEQRESRCLLCTRIQNYWERWHLGVCSRESRNGWLMKLS